MIAQCAGQGVSRIVVCDTTGGATPEEVAHVIGGLVRDYPDAHSGSTGTPIAALVWPMRGRRFWRARSTCRAR